MTRHTLRIPLGLGLVLLAAMAAGADARSTVAQAAAAPVRGVATVPVRTPPSGAPAFAASRVIVGFTATADAADRAAALRAVGNPASERLSPKTPRAERWLLKGGRTVADAVATLRRLPQVRYAEPDYALQAVATSNDPYVTGGSLWGVYGDASSPANQWGSQAAEAWTAGYTGSRNVYIGVIDEGIDFSHPDLAANVWTNPFDPADGVDNDGNGKVDDVRGWDFFNNDASIYDGAPGNSVDAHGTHVSGTIGGLGGNGIGVAGVNWNVTVISGKFLGPNGGSTSGAVEALDYFTDLKTRHGLNIVATSNSWGGGGYSQALQDAINRAGNAGILFIAAAGNSSANNDTTASYPSNYRCTTTPTDCVIAVAATTSTGGLASFSSFGATTVDIGAPGSGIISTTPNNAYSNYSGTSMATPHVSGAAALCASINPGLTMGQLREAILGSTVATASLTGKTATGGRLDVGSMVALCNPPTAPPSGEPSNLVATTDGASRVGLTWTDGTTDETRFDVQRAPVVSGVCGTFGALSPAGANATSYTDSNLSAATSYCYRVRGANSIGTTAWTAVAMVTTASPPSPYTCTSSTFAWLDPSGGTTHALTDDGAVTIALPFAFPSYGASFTSAQISSNGYLRLDGGAATAYTNVAIPNTADPNAMIAAAWDDWNPGIGGVVSSRTTGTAPNRRVVVTWSNVPPYGGTAVDGASFQIVLDEGGGFTLQYLDMLVANAALDNGASATAGVENTTGDAGTQVSSNAGVLSGGTARFCTDQTAVAPTIATATALPNATETIAYATTLSATGGSSPYTWTVESGSLPAGLQLNDATGEITGTPAAAGTSSFTVGVKGADARASTKAFTLKVAALPAITSGPALPAGGTGDAYSQTLAATGGSGFVWTLAGGALPAGLSLSSAGVISGTPTTAGTAAFTVRVTNADGGTATQALTIDILAVLRVTTASLASGTGGSAYTQALAASGAVGTVAWSATGLPAGLVLNATTGAISGTPTASGSFSVTISATTPTQTANRTLPLTVAFGRLSPANGATLTTRTSATLTWSAHTGAASYRYCFTSSNKGCTPSTIVSGTSVTVGLNARTTYYWRVTAYDAGGTAIAQANANALWRFTTAR